MKKFKQILVLICLFCCILLGSAGTLVPPATVYVGGDFALPPYEFLDDKGNPAGFSVELTQAIAKAMGFKVNIKLTSLEKALQNLDGGYVHVAEAVFYSEVRDKKYDFSTPYVEMHYSIFAKKGTPKVKTIEGLKGKSVVVLNKDFIHEYLLNNKVTDKVSGADSTTSALKLLDLGACDYALLNTVPAFYWMKRLEINDIQAVSDPMFPQKLRYCVLNGDTELLDKLNEGLAILKNNGTYDDLYDKWLGIGSSKIIPQEKFIRYAAYVVIPVLILLGLIFSWTISLRQQVKSRTKALQGHVDQLILTEMELMDSRNKLSGIIENIDEGIFVHSRERKIIIANKAACKILGLKSEDVIGKNTAELGLKLYNEDGGEFDPMQTPASKVLRGEEAGRATYFGVTSGTKANKWLLVSASPVFDPISHELMYAIANFADITELKEMELALKQSEERYRSLFMHLTEGFLYNQIVFGECGRAIGTVVLEANEAFCREVEIRMDAVLGKDLSDLLTIDRSSFVKWLNEQEEKGEDSSGMVMECYDPMLDKWFYLSVYCPQPGYVAVVVTNISSRKTFENKMRHLNEDLEARVQSRTLELIAVNKELEAFSYSVSHDLRAPLQSISGFSQALLEDYAEKLDEEGRHYLNRVRAASQKMAGLIDDLLALSRITRGNLKKEPVNLTEIAKEIAAELRSEQPDRRVEFVIAEGINAYGDPDLLRIMLENLLGNAWKYTEKKEMARIEFSTFVEDNQQIYFVKDNGAGFDMRYANELFGAIQRPYGADEFEGNSIGLVTIQRIVSRHGGKVWAKGELNQGAEFFFTLE